MGNDTGDSGPKFDAIDQAHFGIDKHGKKVEKNPDSIQSAPQPTEEERAVAKAEILANKKKKDAATKKRQIAEAKLKVQAWFDADMKPAEREAELEMVIQDLEAAYEQVEQKPGESTASVNRRSEEALEELQQAKIELQVLRARLSVIKNRPTVKVQTEKVPKPDTNIQKSGLWFEGYLSDKKGIKPVATDIIYRDLREDGADENYNRMPNEGVLVDNGQESTDFVTENGDEEETLEELPELPASAVAENVPDTHPLVTDSIIQEVESKLIGGKNPAEYRRELVEADEYGLRDKNATPERLQKIRAELIYLESIRHNTEKMAELQKKMQDIADAAVDADPKAWSENDSSPIRLKQAEVAQTTVNVPAVEVSAVTETSKAPDGWLNRIAQIGNGIRTGEVPAPTKSSGGFFGRLKSAFDSVFVPDTKRVPLNGALNETLTALKLKNQQEKRNSLGSYGEADYRAREAVTQERTTKRLAREGTWLERENAFVKSRYEASVSEKEQTELERAKMERKIDKRMAEVGKRYEGKMDQDLPTASDEDYPAFRAHLLKNRLADPAFNKNENLVKRASNEYDQRRIEIAEQLKLEKEAASAK